MGEALITRRGGSSEFKWGIIPLKNTVMYNSSNAWACSDGKNFIIASGFNRNSRVVFSLTSQEDYYFKTNSGFMSATFGGYKDGYYHGFHFQSDGVLVKKYSINKSDGIYVSETLVGQELIQCSVPYSLYNNTSTTQAGILYGDFLAATSSSEVFVLNFKTKQTKTSSLTRSWIKLASDGKSAYITNDGKLYRIDENLTLTQITPDYNQGYLARLNDKVYLVNNGRLGNYSVFELADNKLVQNAENTELFATVGSTLDGYFNRQVCCQIDDNSFAVLGNIPNGTNESYAETCANIGFRYIG